MCCEYTLIGPVARPKPRRSGQAGQVMRGSSGHIRQTTRDRCVRIRFLHAYELSITAKTGTTATKNLEEDARTHHPPPEPPQLPKGCKRTKGHAATASQAYSTAPCGVASVPSRSPASFNVVREKVEMVRLLSPMWDTHQGISRSHFNVPVRILIPVILAARRGSGGGAGGGGLSRIQKGSSSGTSTRTVQ